MRRLPPSRCNPSSPSAAERLNLPVAGPDKQIGTGRPALCRPGRTMATTTSTADRYSRTPARLSPLRAKLQEPAAQGLMLLAPAVLVYALFAFYPMLDVIHLSFMKWNGLTADKQWAGLENYRYVLTDDTVFWVALRNTLIWTALSVIFPPLLGFGLALSLNQNIPGRSPLRALFYMPVIIAPIAVATMWRWMYDPFFGLFGSLLTSAGWTGLI